MIHHPRLGFGLVSEDQCDFIIPGWFGFHGFICFHHSRYDLI